MILTWFDIAILVITVITLIRGYMTGITMQLATLLGIILGVKYASTLSHTLVPYISKYATTSARITELICSIIAFLIIFLALFLIGKLITKVLKPINLGILNRIAGSLFCTIKWLFIISVLLNFITITDKQDVLIKETTRKNSLTYSSVKGIAPTIIPYLNLDWMTDHN